MENKTNLADLVANRTNAAPEAPRELRTRPLTGKTRHPLILIAGRDKVGKSYALAQASADPRVARTTVIEVGGDTGAMDAYGALDGARVELVEHDGSWGDITASIQAAIARPAVEGGYNILAIDNVTSLWRTLTTQAQRGGRDLTSAGWSNVNATWDDLLAVLRQHDGPVVLIARVDGDTLVDDTLGKVRTQKDLAYECDVVIRATGHRSFALTGVRSTALVDAPVPVEFGDLVLADVLDLVSGSAA